VYIPFEREGHRYTLIDTAGLRRKGRTHETIEKFSALKTLEAIRQAHVVILVLDARQGLAEQDQHIVGHVLDAGRALVVGINKWDGLDADTKRRVRSEHDRRFGFIGFAETRCISALHGTGVGELLDGVRRAHAAAMRDLSTHELTRTLEDAVAGHQPPLVGGARVKLRYAHQGGSNPPTIVVHGTRVSRLPAAYKRYLENTFRREFDLRGTPIRMEFRAGENPYAGKKRASKKKSAGKKKARRR
jgi:GTP-binding protein